MDKKILFIAAACHAANVAYSMSIGDTSLPPWAEYDEKLRNSVIEGVRKHLENPDMTPEQAHESWMARRVQEGWKFGPEKNLETKEHPCLVPYADLPASMRSKDYIFKAVVGALRDLPAHAFEDAPPAAAASPAAPAAALHIKGLMPITYVGRRETYKDGLYGTNLTFSKGQTRMVPADKGALMLRHPDTYALGKTTDAIAQQSPDGSKRTGNTPEQDEEDRREDVLRSLSTMNRRQMAHFAKVTFNRDMDPEKQDAPAMRAEIQRMIDQVGLP